MKRLLYLAVPLLAITTVWWARSGPAGVEVDLEPVRREARFVSTVTASGEIVATRYADIGSDLMGRVVELAVQEGDEVERGQQLARIDATQARSTAEAAEAQVQALLAELRSARETVENTRAQVREAEAQQQEAVRRLERAQSLYERGVLSRAEFDEAESAADGATARLAALRAGVSRAEQQAAAAELRVAQARAQGEGASDLLAKTRIVAPIDGTVTRLNVREGEMVVIGIQNQPGTTLMTISDLAALNAEVRVAEADVPRLRLGQRASITLEALPDRSFEGQVVEIGSSALPAAAGASAREFRVVVRLDEPDPALRPGFTCDSEIVTEVREDALTVPLQAVVLREAEDGTEETGVFLADGDTALFTPVETGIIGGIRMQVRGLEEGEQVVAGPYQVLRGLEDGARITARSR